MVALPRASLCSNFLDQMSHILLPCLPALMQVIFVGSKFAATFGADNFGKGRSVKVVAHRITIEPDHLCNRHLTHSLFMQVHHLFIATLAFRSPYLLLRCPWGFRLGFECLLCSLLTKNRWRKCLRCLFLIGLLGSSNQFQTFMLSLKHALERISQIHELVEAVTHLLCIWRALSRSV